MDANGKSGFIFGEQWCPVTMPRTSGSEPALAVVQSPPMPSEVSRGPRRSLICDLLTAAAIANFCSGRAGLFVLARVGRVVIRVAVGCDVERNLQRGCRQSIDRARLLRRTVRCVCNINLTATSDYLYNSGCATYR